MNSRLSRRGKQDSSVDYTASILKTNRNYAFSTLRPNSVIEASRIESEAFDHLHNAAFGKKEAPPTRGTEFPSKRVVLDISMYGGGGTSTHNNSVISAYKENQEDKYVSLSKHK